MAPSRSSPEIAYYRGAYDECRRLLTSPRFTRPQRELIEQEAHRIKAELEQRGVAFQDPIPTA
jgi:hypothetical protein